jgi:hypothetical protein
VVPAGWNSGGARSPAPSALGLGPDAARQIRTESPDTAILVLSAHAEVGPAMELLATGQRIGYLLKSRVTNVDEFLDTLQRIVKGVLVVALLRNKLWAYPWMIAVLLLFIGYQAYRIALTPSAGLIALTVFDITIVALTVREYQRQRTARRTQDGTP